MKLDPESRGSYGPVAAVAVADRRPAVARHGLRRLGDVANGTIKRLVRDRGFGFIRDDGGQEWFFHRSSVKAGSFDQLNEGQRVSFDEEPSAKGPRAGNIRSES
jgi:CspA family cold shock protein